MDEQVALHLNEYKKLIDFSDLTEKQNYKWISMYVAKFHKKVNVEEMIQFLRDAISIHIQYRCRGMWLVG